MCRNQLLAYVVTLLLLTVGSARAALQFDVFLGFDGATREGNWFPVACEVFNDGPTFNAIFEVVNDSDLRRGQTRRVMIELPTNTRKRFVIPVFSSGRHSSWSARLIDDRGKVRAEQTSLSAKSELNHDCFMLGAVPRMFGGLPIFPNLRPNHQELQPAVTRMEVAHFPDNSVAFEALNALYLNSEKALDLKKPQIDALIAWLNGGGHLIVAVEQPTDVNGTPWLRNLLPCDITGVTSLTMSGEFQNWVQTWATSLTVDSGLDANTQRQRNRTRAPLTSELLASVTKADADFEGSSLPVAEATVREGQVLLNVKGHPLMVQAPRGRGKITVLAFSPERDPFRAWKNKSWFWARTAELPSSLFAPYDNNNYYGRWGIDGVFGAMLDSRQVRKLPVGWLLVLLVVYLLVVGPLDQYWLKKINRQMLTWITFPTYVVLFSVLIYWIGFMLRAGEVEWNELHVVDVLPLPGGDRAHLRGQMYASIYSPSNAKYELASETDTARGNPLLFATLRGEFSGGMGSGQESSRASVQQRGDGFRAEMFVPVWVSQLYVSDWLQASAQPLGASVIARSGNYDLLMTNKLSRPLTGGRLIVNRRVYELGTLGPQEIKRFTFSATGGTDLLDFVNQNAGNFQYVMQQRRNAFGDETSGRLDANPTHVLAACFAPQMAGSSGYGAYGYQSKFIAPERFDLMPVVERGDAIVVAWDSGNAPISPLNKFSPRRTHRDTFYRLTMKVEKP